LDALEDRLQVLASLLRGIRNVKQPIHQLPPEILFAIFSSTQQHLPSFLPLPDMPPNPIPGTLVYDSHFREWLSLLHVCRHWRGVIAQLPLLWSEIDGNLVPKSFLRRAKGAQLTVYLGIRKYGYPKEVLEALIPRIARIKELHVAGGSLLNLDGGIYKKFDLEADSLQSLTLVTDGRHPGTDILPRLFGGETPVLKMLTLEHFTSWPGNSFDNLTHLCLYDQPIGSGMTTAYFLDFLEQSPLLEELALIRAGPILPNEEDEPVFVDRFVHLKNLKELNIGDWPSPFPGPGPAISPASLVARFLSHLMIPRSARTFIWPLHLRPDEDLTSYLPLNITSLHFNLQCVENWYFTCQPPVISGVPFMAIIGSTQTLYTYGTFHANQILPMVRPSFTPSSSFHGGGRFPISQLRTFVIRDSCTRNERLPTGVWKELLDAMPKLTSLRVLAFDSPTTTRSVLSALLPEEDPVLKEEVVSCPTLKSLGIEHDATLPSFFIGRVAAERARLGKPIQSVKVLVYSTKTASEVFVPPRSSFSRSRSPRSDLPPLPADEEESDDREQEFLSRTKDDLELLKDHVKELLFEHKRPLSTDMVPPGWPTKPYQWTTVRRGPQFDWRD
jgi:hypothetical protein